MARLNCLPNSPSSAESVHATPIHSKSLKTQAYSSSSSSTTSIAKHHVNKTNATSRPTLSKQHNSSPRSVLSSTESESDLDAFFRQHFSRLKVSDPENEKLCDTKSTRFAVDESSSPSFSTRQTPRRKAKSLAQRRLDLHVRSWQLSVQTMSEVSPRINDTYNSSKPARNFIASKEAVRTDSQVALQKLQNWSLDSEKNDQPRTRTDDLAQALDALNLSEPTPCVDACSKRLVRTCLSQSSSSSSPHESGGVQDKSNWDSEESCSQDSCWDELFHTTTSHRSSDGYNSTVRTMPSPNKHTVTIVTPKSRLKSPSKRPPRIPSPPFTSAMRDSRKSTFWSPTTVNAWNDTHSPVKNLDHCHIDATDLSGDSPVAISTPKSSRKSKVLRTVATPKGRGRKDQHEEVVTKCKTFKVKKYELAEQWFKAFDARVCSGKIEQLSRETGGVRFDWSKKLNTTAGRARWRGELVKDDKAQSGWRERHYACIELAEKVIDNEYRLKNVIAHEFCHLANFMISRIRDNPHGKQFKIWARKLTEAFTDEEIRVTTKHSFAISYKYEWQCQDCTQVYQRHSKSIDPLQRRCGVCRGLLVQTRPAPRGSGSLHIPQKSAYQIYVQQNYQTVKRELMATDAKASGSHKSYVFRELAQRYRAHKSASGVECPQDKVEVNGDGPSLNLSSSSKTFRTTRNDNSRCCGSVSPKENVTSKNFSSWETALVDGMMKITILD